MAHLRLTLDGCHGGPPPFRLDQQLLDWPDCLAADVDLIAFVVHTQPANLPLSARTDPPRSTRGGCP